jgi:hypothetical protein
MTADALPLTGAERAELEFLRAENDLLRAERAILLRVATDTATYTATDSATDTATVTSISAVTAWRP